MGVLAAILLLIGAGGIYFTFAKNEIQTAKGKLISFSVGLVACIIAVVILACSGSDGDSDWDKLSKDEKEWYKDNYGSGQYDSYKDAINNYKGY